jgi:hypothetical protein
MIAVRSYHRAKRSDKGEIGAMASIKQYDGSGRATVKRKGHGVLFKHFPTKDEAELWASKKET